MRLCEQAVHHLLLGLIMALLLITGRGAIKMHGGFYNGAKRHLAEIAAVVRACDERACRRLPVWVTGHSLGGGYANALALHLLAQQNTAELFGAGTPLPDFLWCREAQLSVASHLPLTALTLEGVHGLFGAPAVSMPCAGASRADGCLRQKHIGVCRVKA